jgi:hypothetical protein
VTHPVRVLERKGRFLLMVLIGSIAYDRVERVVPKSSTVFRGLQLAPVGLFGNIKMFIAMAETFLLKTP